MDAKVILSTALLLLLLGCAARPNVFVDINGERYAFNVEVADEFHEWRQGLMDRATLGEREGMLFIFPEAMPREFWMKNTTIPLTMLFFDSSRELVGIHDATPCTADPCPRYASGGLAQYVLEINQGIISADTTDATLQIIK